MTFISYAQNFEDVILDRAFKDVDGGFYVDVGAQDPTQYSVTRAFYDRGWHGINIEPVFYWYERLRDERPRDTNLRVAVDDTSGKQVFYEIDGTGLSTLRKDIAERHAQDGYEVRRYEVPVRTLDSILSEYWIDVIHFLKIDVEGTEGGALSSLDFERFRPWVLVVEATEPNSTKVAYYEWHDMLSQHNYECVYFDGLNRFYLASEQWERRFAFQEPPNVFDEFISYTELDARQQLIRANHDLELSRHELNGLYNSMSWRITRPVRILAAAIQSARSLLRRLRTVAVRTGRSVLRFVLRGISGVLSRLPGVRARVSRILDMCPTVKARLQSLIIDVRNPGPTSIDGFTWVARDESSLTRRGREVYRILFDASKERDR